MLGFLYAFFIGGLALAIGGSSSGGGSTPPTTSAGPVPDPEPSLPDPAALDAPDPDAGGGGVTGGDSGGGDGGAIGGGSSGDGGGINGGGESGPPSDVPDLPSSAFNIGWAGLTAEEQLIVELVNRARMDPLEEVDRLDEGLASGIPSQPVQPLAVTEGLSDAARGHSEDMDNRNFFDHTNPDGEGPGARAIDAGHGSGYVGENIGWIGSTVSPNVQARAEGHHTNLWESDGHQRNLMDEDWSEIGVGYDYASYRGYDHSTFVTELFGDRGDTYLTGVVIDDEDGDDFYDIGEGQGGVQITAYDGDTAYATATWDAGGYSLALPPGNYRVVFEGGDLDQPYETEVAIGNENVKLDVIEDNGAVAATLNANALLPGLAVEEGDTMAWVEDTDGELELLEMI